MCRVCYNPSNEFLARFSISGLMMDINKLLRTSSHPPRADKSAMGAINDSVGKIGRDQMDQATSKGKRCAKQAEQAKALTGQHDVCRETHQVCLYYT